MELTALISFPFLLLAFHSHSSSSSSTNPFSLSVEKAEQDIITSQNGNFAAGFHAVGANAYCFAIWFTQPHRQNRTVVWMANRDQPVNGKRSKLFLHETGNLILTDAGQFNIWATNTSSSSSLQLLLKSDGNLVLREPNGDVLWQSFDFPTNTLLPGQNLTRHTQLVSSRSETDHSSGFYKLFFDNDNLLSLLYDGPEVSSVFWPDPWLVSWDAGRSTYNSSRIAVMDLLGNFSSSDDYHFRTSDYGVVIQRRLTIDYDGNVRVYSRKHVEEKWYVSWQVNSNPCKIHGICGANSYCNYDHNSGRKCSCLPGYRLKNGSDWSKGCEPKFKSSCNRNDSVFLKIDYLELYGYIYGFFPNYSYKQCEDLCLQLCNCKGFQYNFHRGNGSFNCYPKTLLLNGYLSPSFQGVLYLRLPKSTGNSYSNLEPVGKCNYVNFVNLQRVYVKKYGSSFLKLLLWLACGFGAFEIICVMCWYFLNKSPKIVGYQYLTAAGFRKFSYSELKKATKGFSQEIGKGAGGIVYKGELSDQRVAAIKRLNEANQGESEFLVEVSIVGRLNHMNLIEMWGYCIERKHRLLVYEYMENGSLADNLLSNKLDWVKRYEIALGMARGLAYLHEECLEWILHCDIKPQNILLDSNYQPKVADFGLSKLRNRNDVNHSSFSTIRGTRGYMAPEWIFNLPITSKVDVYSYGIVVLEMITGKNPLADFQTVDGVEAYNGRLVTLVREKKSKASEMGSWVEQIIDPVIGGNCDLYRMGILARVALDCVEEDKDVRPTMSQIVEMLQTQESDI